MYGYKDILLCLVAIIVLGGFFVAMFVYANPQKICVDNELYEIRTDYAVALNVKCLPVDKD
jgi:hypothetical protein